MPTVTMPQLGESVAEGTIGKWLKQVGDHVDKLEPIVEVITDKVNAEVPSPFEGVLTQILVQEGQTVPNHAEIAVIEAAGAGAAAVPLTATPQEGTAPATAPAVVAGAEAVVDEVQAADMDGAASVEVASTGSDQPSAAVPAPASAPATTGDPTATSAVPAFEGRMTPAVRRLAREHGVDLSRVTGTGHGGRITREDVLGFVAVHGSTPGSDLTPAPTPPQTAPTPPAATSATPAPSVPPSPVAAGDSLKQLSPMRRAIAAQMTRSLGVPAAYITVEVDMTAVVRRRDSAKREYQAAEGKNLSYVAFVTKACVEALRKHPDLNAHWTDEGHWRRQAVNIGVAVAVDDGLVVPVIRDADRLSLHGLNKAINDVADRARANRLRLHDISGGTFTVDNTGWTGSILTLPIINVPEVAILTMEAIVKRPVVIEGPAGDAIAVRHMMNMVLGFDHRASDGAQAGRFLADVRRWLESVDDQTPIW